jgi:hypothetical protein
MATGQMSRFVTFNACHDIFPFSGGSVSFIFNRIVMESNANTEGCEQYVYVESLSDETSHCRTNAIPKLRSSPWWPSSATGTISAM